MINWLGGFSASSVIFLSLTVVACVFGYIGYMLYTDDLSIKDVASGTTTGLNDIENWGRLYLGIDGPKKVVYNSFAEEMLLSGINEDKPEEDDDEDEDDGNVAQQENENDLGGEDQDAGEESDNTIDGSESGKKTAETDDAKNSEQGGDGSL